MLLSLAPSLPRIRYKVRPARAKPAKLGLFGRAGRVLYRTCGEKGCVGRVLYRTCGEKGRAGRVLYRKWGRATRAGRVLSRRGTLLVPSCRPCVARGHRGQPPSPVVHPGFAVSQRLFVGGGGFALHEAFWARVIGVSEPHVVQFPPFGGGEAAVRGGAAPKVQTTSVKMLITGCYGRGGLRFGQNSFGHGVLFARSP